MDKPSLIAKSDNSVTAPNSTKSSVEAIARSLDLAAAIWGKELTVEEIAFWKETLEKYPPEKITAAFGQFCRVASQETFFPRPGDITELIDEMIDQEKPFISVGAKVRAQLRG